MTVAIYELTDNGRMRLGTMRVRGNSIRAIASQFYKRHPRASGQYFIAPRRLMMGRWTDGELLPMEPRSNA